MSLKQLWFNFKSNSRFSAKVKLENLIADNKEIHLVTTIFLSPNLIFFTIIVPMNTDTIDQDLVRR